MGFVSLPVAKLHIICVNLDTLSIPFTIFVPLALINPTRSSVLFPLSPFTSKPCVFLLKVISFCREFHMTIIFVCHNSSFQVISFKIFFTLKLFEEIIKPAIFFLRSWPFYNLRWVFIDIFFAFYRLLVMLLSFIFVCPINFRCLNRSHFTSFCDRLNFELLISGRKSLSWFLESVSCSYYINGLLKRGLSYWLIFRCMQVRDFFIWSTIRSIRFVRSCVRGDPWISASNTIFGDFFSQFVFIKSSGVFLFL